MGFSTELGFVGRRGPLLLERPAAAGAGERSTAASRRIQVAVASFICKAETGDQSSHLVYAAGVTQVAQALSSTNLDRRTRRT